MSPAAIERIATALAWTAAGLVAAALLWIIGDVLARGLPGLDLAFLLQDPIDSGRAGGIRSVLAATGLILFVAIAAAAPLGLMAGILLADYAGEHPRLAPAVRRSLDTLAGVPSIVFGLFGNAVFAQLFGWRVSILSGGLTLAVMILPFLIRSVEESLRSLPAALKSTGAALGLSQITLLLQIRLPAAAPGLAAGLVLGLGRALAETAALVFTSGYVARMPSSVFDSGRTLSVHVLELAMNVPGGTANAYKTAAVLILLLLAINAAVMGLARLTRPKGVRV